MLEKEKKREIIRIIRIFNDGQAQMIEGKLLKEYLERQRIIENLMDDHGGDIDPDRRFWVPIEMPKIKPIKKP